MTQAEQIEILISFLTFFCTIYIALKQNEISKKQCEISEQQNAITLYGQRVELLTIIDRILLYRECLKSVLEWHLRWNYSEHQCSMLALSEWIKLYKPFNVNIRRIYFICSPQKDQFKITNSSKEWVLDTLLDEVTIMENKVSGIDLVFSIDIGQKTQELIKEYCRFLRKIIYFSLDKPETFSFEEIENLYLIILSYDEKYYQTLKQEINIYNKTSS